MRHMTLQNKIHKLTEHFGVGIMSEDVLDKYASMYIISELVICMYLYKYSLVFLQKQISINSN